MSNARYVPPAARPAHFLSCLTGILFCLTISACMLRAQEGDSDLFSGLDVTVFQGMVDISASHATHFRLTASIRVNGSDASSLAMIAASCTDDDGTPYFFEEMNEGPAKSPEWKRYTIEGAFRNTPSVINLFGLCKGEGSFYFDDFRLYTRKGAKGKWKPVKWANGGFEAGFPGPEGNAWVSLIGAGYYIYEAENSHASEGKYCLHILGDNIPDEVPDELLTDGKKGDYTRADSLRGTLSPDRSCYDVTYYHLNTRVNPADKSVGGYTDIQFRVVAPTRRMQVDLFANMQVDGITWKGMQLPYDREDNAVFIDFPEGALVPGQTETIRFAYSGKPKVSAMPPWDGGFTWAKDGQGNPWVAVSCQGFGASCWWPNKDHQSEEPDSMLISIEVPNGLMDISNGRLRGSEDLGDGFTRYNWFVSNPINNYNVTVNIGKYAYFGEENNGLTLDYYVLVDNLDKAKKHFQQVKPMMNCFEKIFGPYPFYEDGYKLVETPYLGMEHQSAVAYGNKYLNGYLGSGVSSAPVALKWDYIIIHETGHEWFGNNITTYDIADMWVHEGFTSYSECIYVECEYGYQEYLNYTNGLKGGIGNQSPVIGDYGVNQEGSGDMYPKGALLLHTIRGLIDDDARWFAILKGLNEEFRHSIVTSAQVEEYIIQQSGKDLKKVFDQYLRHASLPKLQVRESNGQVQVRWQADVEGFDMPLKISVQGKAYEWIRPTPEWKSVPGAASKADLKVAAELFYFGYEGV